MLCQKQLDVTNGCPYLTCPIILKRTRDSIFWSTNFWTGCILPLTLPIKSKIKVGVLCPIHRPCLLLSSDAAVTWFRHKTRFSGDFSLRSPALEFHTLLVSQKALLVKPVSMILSFLFSYIWLLYDYVPCICQTCISDFMPLIQLHRDHDYAI